MWKPPPQPDLPHPRGVPSRLLIETTRPGGRLRTATIRALMDRLLLEGMVFYGRHGARSAERELGARFTVDVELGLDLRAAGQSDLPADTVDYSEVYEAVREVVEGSPQTLLESVAERIATRLLA